MTCLSSSSPHPASLLPQDIKHRKNEVFLDVVESVNLLVSASGAVLHSDIVGSVQMRVYLTGESSLPRFSSFTTSQVAPAWPYHLLLPSSFAFRNA